MVPPQYAPECWPKIEGYIARAAEYTYGRFTVGNIYDLVVDGDYQLWVAFEGQTYTGAVVTSVMTYPQRKLLCMQFCGGDGIDKWKDSMLALLRRFAKDIGCDGIESTGRPGWAKIFKNDGYKATWVTYELPLDMEKENG